jgi:hypothetical protein
MIGAGDETSQVLDFRSAGLYASSTVYLSYWYFPVCSQEPVMGIQDDSTLVIVHTAVAGVRRRLSKERSAEFEALWARDNQNQSEKAKILNEPVPAIRNARWNQYVAGHELEEAWNDCDYKTVILKSKEVDSWKNEVMRLRALMCQD